MPVSVRQVVQAGAGLQVAGVEAGLLTLVVQVKQVTRTETGISYMVDDDTGRIEAVHYVESEVAPAQLNTFVRLFGLLKCGREQNMITVYKLFPVLDRQERDAHLLALVVLPLRLQRLAAGQARLVSTLQPVVGGAGEQQQLQYSWPVQAVTQPANPAAIVLLRSIKNCLEDTGISRQQLQLKHRLDMQPSQVDEVLRHLSYEGHVYNTIDENYFKSTDA